MKIPRSSATLIGAAPITELRTWDASQRIPMPMYKTRLESSSDTSVVSPSASPVQGQEHGQGYAQGDELPLLPGDILSGSYELGELLGRGGTSSVYTAIDQHLGREVAIKIAWSSSDQSLLRREARVLAALDHPGIVRVHAFGIHQGLEYLVMQRLRGVTLHEHLQRSGRRTRLLTGEALDIAIAIADVLTAIHEAGFVHRDLKPGNIMLTPENQVVLFDLGVSAGVEEAAREERLIGSPHYIAPEAIAATIDPGQAPLIDLYAIGVILFEMLAGRRPFNGSSAQSVINTQLRTDAPPLSRFVRAPARLSRLVAAMLDRDPARRPRSSAQVATWLRAIRRDFSQACRKSAVVRRALSRPISTKTLLNMTPKAIISG